MVHSTWGDCFVLDEAEAAEPDGLWVWYLGCNGFVVRSPEVTLYIGLYFGDGDPSTLVRMVPVPVDPEAATAVDAVIVTHEHLDHMHLSSYRGLIEAGATLYAPRASFENPDYEGGLVVSDSARRVVAVGETIEVGDLSVHVGGANDPDAIETVSYIIEHATGAFFHAGDSKPAEAFAELGERFDIDAGVLAFGSRGRVPLPAEGTVERVEWYMDADQVVEAANQLRLDRLLPSHWDMWKSTTADPKALVNHARTHEYPRRIDLIEVGDWVDLGRPGVRPMRSLG